MVKNDFLILVVWLTLPLISPEKGHTQAYEQRTLNALSLQTELPTGMISRPLPAQKNLPLAFWGVRSDTANGIPQVGLQVFGFDARNSWSATEQDSMLAFIYQQVFDTITSTYTWTSFMPCPFAAPCNSHYTDTLLIDGEAYLGVVLTSFHAPKQWTWVWYAMASHVNFLKESATKAWKELTFRPQNVADAKQRITYTLPQEWVALKGKDDDFRLVPRQQMSQSVLSEKMGYHTVEGYVITSDSLFFEDMMLSLQNQGFNITKRFNWDRFTGFEIHIGQPEDPGTHGLYLFWPPSGRMRWPYGFFYVSTTPLETEKVSSFFFWLDSVRFMED
jgi:hypothetical protein